jgi:hypothetical protein
MPCLVPPNAVFSEAVIVFLTESLASFGVLTSSFHREWAFKYGSAIKSDLRYIASRCFEMFPLPEPKTQMLGDRMEFHSRTLNDFRAALMVETEAGLTKIYNAFNGPEVGDPDIVRLRELHVELDLAVRDAYGWADLELDHHHWETPQGMRFTVSPEAREELLDRLLELNHERYAAEVAAGLHDKKAKKAPAKRSAKPVNPSQETVL